MPFENATRDDKWRKDSAEVMRAIDFGGLRNGNVSFKIYV